jgi:hypothetical protein
MGRRPALTLAYDATDAGARRAVAQFRALDVTHAVTVVDVADLDPGDDLTARARRSGVAVAGNTGVDEGSEALRAAARRAPLARLVERRLIRALTTTPAGSAGCARPAHAPVGRAADRSGPIWPVATLGTVLIGTMLYTGAHNHVRAWPVSSYPDFRGIAGPQRNLVTLAVTGRDGSASTLSMGDIFGSWTTPDRYESLIGEVITTTDPGRKARKVAALWAVARHHTEAARDAASVEIHLDVLSTDPDDRAEPPLEHHVLYGFTIDEAGGGPPVLTTVDGHSVRLNPLP